MHVVDTLLVYLHVNIVNISFVLQTQRERLNEVLQEMEIKVKEREKQLTSQHEEEQQELQQQLYTLTIKVSIASLAYIQFHLCLYVLMAASIICIYIKYT